MKKFLQEMPDMQMRVYYHLPMGTFFTKPRRGDKIDAHTLVPDARIMNAYKREEQERERREEASGIFVDLRYSKLF